MTYDISMMRRDSDAALAGYDRRSHGEADIADTEALADCFEDTIRDIFGH